MIENSLSLEDCVMNSNIGDDGKEDIEEPFFQADTSEP